MVTVVFNSAKQYLLNGSIDWENDTIRLALVNNSADSQAFMDDPDPGAATDRETVSDVFGTTASSTPPADEFNGVNYGRRTLTIESGYVTVDPAADTANANADKVVWEGIDNDTIGGALIYQRVGSSDDDSIDRLLCVLDSPDLPMTTNGGGITAQFGPNGVIVME